MRCVCVRGNERERESIENVFFFSFFSILISFNMFFLERDKKMRCICGSGDWKELEKCRKYFFRSLIFT